MKWTNVKPSFKRECLLITASNFRGVWEYNLWMIKKISTDEGWYFGWLTSDGEEYGDLADLKAERYLTMTLAPIEKALNKLITNEQSI